MSDPKFSLRAGESGALVEGTPGNVLTFQSDGTLRGEAPASGGAVVPSQNVRYLDAASLVAPPTGSVAAPYVDPQDFVDAVVAAGADTSWLLALASGANPDFTVPDLEAGVVLVFRGLSASASALGSIPVVAQTNAITLEFQDLSIGTLTMAGAPNATLVFESCTLGQSEPDGTVSGRVRFVNCTIENAWRHPEVDATFVDCSISGAIEAAALVCTGCRFENSTDLNFELARLLGCTFGISCTITVPSNQVLTMDQQTFFSMRDAGVLFPDTPPAIALEPNWSPVMTSIQDTAFNLGPGVSERTLATVPANPPAAKSSLAMVQWVSDAGGVAAVVLGARTDNTGAIVLMLLNPTLATITVDEPVWVVQYLPRVDP
jgi:hypothetical protein